MSDVEMSLTARQYVLLMDLLNSLPRALAFAEEDVEESQPTTPATASAPPTPRRESDSESEQLVNLEPELTVAKVEDSTSPALWTALQVAFTVGSIALEVYDITAHAEHDLKQHSIARFALVKSHLGLKRLSDGAMEAEFSLNTLAFSSTRSGNSVHRDIIPHTTQNGNQM